jgi:hypothetical protein
MCKIVCLLGSTDFVWWNLDSRRSRACPAIAQPAWSSVGPASRSSMHGRNTSSTAPAGPGAAGRCRGGRRDVKCFCSDAGLGRPSAGATRAGPRRRLCSESTRTAPWTASRTAPRLFREPRCIRKSKVSALRPSHQTGISTLPCSRTSRNSAVLPFGIPWRHCRRDPHDPNITKLGGTPIPWRRSVSQRHASKSTGRNGIDSPAPATGRARRRGRAAASSARAISAAAAASARSSCLQPARLLLSSDLLLICCFGAPSACRRGAPSVFRGAPSVCRGAPSVLQWRSVGFPWRSVGLPWRSVGLCRSRPLRLAGSVC